MYAAAQTASADALVTFNLKDFPAVQDWATDVRVMHPDVLLLSLADQDQRSFEAAVEHEAARMQRPPTDAEGVLRGVATTVPTAANLLHNHWGEEATRLPAFEAATLEESPWGVALREPHFTNPQHVITSWWVCLNSRQTDPVALETFHDLTWSPDAFGDFRWVDVMLEGFSLASKVYYAIDATEKDVAFMRFIPEVAEAARAFAPMRFSGAVFVTLVRMPDQTWRVWGLGDSIPATRSVKRV